MFRAGIACLLLVAAGGCQAEPTQETHVCGAWLPPPAAPDDNPTTPERAELGRHLFYDRRMSGKQNQACADCHKQSLAFTDGKPRSEGSTGQLTRANSPSIVNAAYAASLTHANFLLRELENQALVPMFSEDPVELGLSNMDAKLFARLRAEPRYVALFARAFPDEADPVSVRSITFALASFQRTVVSARSPYDCYEHGHKDALSPAAQRGLALFESSRLGCTHCHSGPLLSAAVDPHAQGAQEPRFENNGLHAEYAPHDRGLYELTLDDHDIGKLKPASLRNVALTAPYMFDGSLATLDDVIDHYARGGEASPTRSPFITGFQLSDAEHYDLLAFLNSLTDDSVIHDPALSDPWQ